MDLSFQTWKHKKMFFAKSTTGDKRTTSFIQCNSQKTAEIPFWVERRTVNMNLVSAYAKRIFFGIRGSLFKINTLRNKMVFQIRDDLHNSAPYASNNKITGTLLMKCSEIWEIPVNQGYTELKRLLHVNKKTQHRQRKSFNLALIWRQWYLSSFH